VNQSQTVAARRVNTRANTKAIEPLKGSPVPFSSAAMSDDPTSTKARDKTRKRPDVIEMMEDSDDDEVRVLAVVSLPMQTTATVLLTHTLSFLEQQSAPHAAKDDQVLLCYPFPTGSEELHAAANGLGELSGAWLHGAEKNSESEDDSSGTSPGQAKASSGGSGHQAVAEKRRRVHYLEILVKDFERLDPGKFLNDTLIDFFMQW
jgi:hypothetical protein